MDVGTLGKFLVAGPDATELLERLYPVPRRRPRARPAPLRAAARARHGFVVDDGVVCALDDGRCYVTFTSSGAGRAEAWLRTGPRRAGYEVHIVDLTAACGAINVAGPRARELLGG